METICKCCVDVKIAKKNSEEFIGHETYCSAMTDFAQFKVYTVRHSKYEILVTVAKLVIMKPLVLLKGLHFKHSAHQAHLAQGMTKVK